MALRMLARSFAGRLPIAAPALASRAAASQVLPQLQRVAAASWVRDIGVTALPGRSFAVSAVSKAADAELEAALKQEIEYERDHNNKAVKDFDAPDGWTVSERPGDSVVKLTRSHGAEEVVVEFTVNNQAAEPIIGPLENPEDPEAEQMEEDSTVDLAISFNATVTKGGKALSFELASDGNYLQINHVSIEAADADLDEDEYDGPVFEELDEKVQALFAKYLEERGVDAALGEYLMVVADAKEQSEYARWLADVRSFVAS